MVGNYLNSLALVHGQEFQDDFTPISNPAYQMLVLGINSLSFSIKCYEGSTPDEYIFNSSLNPEVYFIDRKETLFKQLFKPQSYFLKKMRSQ